MTPAPMVLPQGCPVCGVWLQLSNTRGHTVAPHFEACHPGTPVPVVTQP